VFPPALVILSFAPVAIAQSDPKDPLGSVVGLVPLLIGAAVGLAIWLRTRKLALG
jgi:hypothetical protein